MDNNTLQSLLQSTASSFTADRDEAISKINRLIDSPYDPNVDTEKIMKDLFTKWAISELGVNKIASAAQQLVGQMNAQKQKTEPGKEEKKDQPKEK
jgi:hypothetical protein